MDPITIALGLAQFAPVLMRYLGVGEKSVAVAENVIGIAKNVTGTTTGPEAIEALKINQELQFKFQTAVMENDSKLELAYLNDVQDARKRDMAFIDKGTRNYRADFLVASSYLIICIIGWQIWSSSGLDDFQKATVTLILGRLLGYVDQVFQFEFGSTKNNRVKDETIKALTGVK